MDIVEIWNPQHNGIQYKKSKRSIKKTTIAILVFLALGIMFANWINKVGPIEQRMSDAHLAWVITN